MKGRGRARHMLTPDTHLALMVWVAGEVLRPLFFSSEGGEDILFLKMGDCRRICEASISELK